ncbi:MAG: hypothetical protein F6K58_11275 [Symploca sp. SIO2E9]|nr:hypothetical protein [Symploca sp. SIO2E9]
MAVYIIGIGGSGAKCIEAVIQLTAVGLFSEESVESIKPLFVDADETNGNLEQARSSLSIYKKCNDLMAGGDTQQSAWMKTKIESFDLWSPFGSDNLHKDLKAFFNYNTLRQNEPKLANLFDVLYTNDEREVNLDVGFRGRPSLGAAVMSKVDLEQLDQEPWGSLLQQIQGDVSGGSSPKVFLCGSIFGGTGAAGLPTIGRLIANKLKKLNLRDRVKIGCLFLLPYFGFSPTPGTDPEGVYARSENFLLNTEAALRYYVTQAQETFDTVYLLGNRNLSRVEFSVGKNTQRNQPHFIELYAGLAARQFVLTTPPDKGRVVLISREKIGRLTWNDLPDKEQVQQALVNATRFAYAWLAEIVPELEAAKDMGVNRFGRLAPWLTKFYNSRGNSLPDFNDSEQQDGIRVISNWCRDYLRWLRAIHQCEGDTIELFRTNAFANLDGKLKGEDLSTLLVNDNRDRSKKSEDRPRMLKERLNPKYITPPNQGTVGLAKAVYLSCKLK